MLSTASIPELYQHQFDYSVENAKKIYSFYGQNSIDIYIGRHNEGLKLIKAIQKCF